MSVRANIKVATAILFAAAVLAVTVLWNDMPGSFVGCTNEVPVPTSPNEPIQPFIIEHCYRVVPMSERITKLIVALLVLSAVAFVASSVVATARGWTSAAACAASVVLALLSLSYVYAGVRGEWSLPHPISILALGATGAMVGAVASWAFMRWRPNNSLERTRAR